MSTGSERVDRFDEVRRLKEMGIRLTDSLKRYADALAVADMRMIAQATKASKCRESVKL